MEPTTEKALMDQLLPEDQQAQQAQPIKLNVGGKEISFGNPEEISEAMNRLAGFAQEQQEKLRRLEAAQGQQVEQQQQAQQAAAQQRAEEERFNREKFRQLYERPDNPDAIPEALAYAVSNSAIGKKLKEFEDWRQQQQQAVQQTQAAQLQQQIAANFNQFRSQNPDFSQDQVQVLDTILKQQNLAPTAQNMDMAWNWAKARGFARPAPAQEQNWGAPPQQQWAPPAPVAVPSAGRSTGGSFVSQNMALQNIPKTQEALAQWLEQYAAGQGQVDY